MSILGDADPNSPWWVAAGLGAAGVVYGGIRVLDYYRRKKIKWQTAENDLVAHIKDRSAEQQREARRDATDEAWQVVDRLTRELEAFDGKLKLILLAHAQKINEIEARERECAEDRATEVANHARTKTVLYMMMAWAKKQKNPLEVPDELLAHLSSDLPPGSNMHRVLPLEPHDPEFREEL